jgi:hypothetical protein
LLGNVERNIDRVRLPKPLRGVCHRICRRSGCWPIVSGLRSGGGVWCVTGHCIGCGVLSSAASPRSGLTSALSRAY